MLRRAAAGHGPWVSRPVVGGGRLRGAGRAEEGGSQAGAEAAAGSLTRGPGPSWASRKKVAEAPAVGGERGRGMQSWSRWSPAPSATCHH